MKMKKVLALTLSACMSMGLMTGCGSSSAGSSSSGGSSDAKVIKIGVFEPTTGENGGGG